MAVFSPLHWYRRADFLQEDLFVVSGVVDNVTARRVLA
jgi:hypothetical protein